MELSQEKRLQEFISELNEISYKYDIKIWGCGCCHSPRLVDSVTDEILAYEIRWCASMMEAREFDRANLNGYSYNFPPRII